MKRPESKAPAGGLFATSPDLIFYIDGGARGNPGPAGYGVVIQDGSGKTIGTIARSIGRATNNVAEYSALLAALEYAVEQGASRVRVCGDSELVVRQMQGRYKVHSPDLLPLYRQARSLAEKLAYFEIAHIPRERNAEADELANMAMDGAVHAPAQRKPATTSAQELTLTAVYKGGLLQPLAPFPPLEEGAEYEVRLRRRK